jgi:sugar lactone lactonase YvrE
MSQLSLHAEMTLETPSTAVSTTPAGRRFLVLARVDGSDGPQVVEWKDSRLHPYPDSESNGWTPGTDAAKHLVRVNSQRVGPDDHLWLVNVGAPGMGNTTVPGGPKLVRVDVAQDAVQRVYPLESVTKENSFVDDVRFNGRHAYLTDAGAPGLIVLDLETGEGRRVLDGHASVTAQKPLTAEGEEMIGPDGEPVFIHADQLEVSPDGKYLYYQPCSGQLTRLETRYLDDPNLSDSEIASHVEKFADTSSTGGTAIDAAGSIYVSDTDHYRILKITPSGAVSTLVQDRRLVWVDAMWIDDRGTLWLPAAQLNRMAPFQGGTSKVTRPIQVFTIPIGEGPAQNDHR